MAGFTKLFEDIVRSTIWREPDSTRLLWITMLAICDRDGVVNSSVPGLADTARVTLEACVEGLKVLEGPDEWSRSQEHEGRRIERVDGGWKILNYLKYRTKFSAADRREYKRVKQAEYRAGKREKSGKGRGPSGREQRFEKAMEVGDEAGADRIAAEGLGGDGPGDDPGALDPAVEAIRKKVYGAIERARRAEGKGGAEPEPGPEDKTVLESEPPEKVGEGDKFPEV